MSLFVLPPITVPWIRIVGFRRYRVSCPVLSYIVANLLGTVCLVSHHDAARYIDRREYIDSDRTVVYIATGEKQLDGIAQTIDKRMDFRILSAARNAYILVRFRPWSPFFAPAAC